MTRQLLLTKCVAVLAFATLAVIAHSAQVTLAPIDAVQGQPLTAQAFDAPGSPHDWIGLYPIGATDQNFADWFFLNGGKTSNGAAVTSASLTFVPPTTGTWEVRLFPDNTYDRIATSNPAIVTAGPPQAMAASCSHYITVVPHTITAPGVHCLSGAMQLISSQAGDTGIVVASDDVILDLQGRVLAGGAGPGAQSTGVAGTNRRNVTIRNGTIRTFLYGVQLIGPGPNRIENMSFVDNHYFGLILGGQASSVRWTQVINTGGATIPGYTIPIAVSVKGGGVQVTDVNIHDVKMGTPESGCTPSCESVGLHVDWSAGSLVDRVTFSQPGASTNTYAIWTNSGDPAPDSTSLTVRNSVFTRWWHGIQGDSLVKYTDNVFSQVVVNAIGGDLTPERMVDAGGNR